MAVLELTCASFPCPLATNAGALGLPLHFDHFLGQVMELLPHPAGARGQCPVWSLAGRGECPQRLSSWPSTGL